MMNKTMPSFYIPHGGGPAFFMQGAMKRLFEPMEHFLASLITGLEQKPKAILVVTAHWLEDGFHFASQKQPPLIYDYYGFPQETYQLEFTAPCAFDLANQAFLLLSQANIPIQLNDEHGWDHGVFIPLKVMNPAMDIPVLAMSLDRSLDASLHLEAGAALASLRDEGVLIIGSGLSYHNLRTFGGDKEGSKVFDDALSLALEGDLKHRAKHLKAWSSWPHAQASHPTSEHLLPLMLVAGTGSNQPAQKVWAGFVGDTTVSAWRFD